MIELKSAKEIQLMRESGTIVTGALELIKKSIRPGITTGELDRMAEEYMLSKGAKSSSKGYGMPDNRFPAATCISINEVVVHGIPSERELHEGDIVSVDISAYKNGYHADAARTFTVGEISAENQRLIKVTRDSFYEGIRFARKGCRLHDISAAIQAHIESNGFHVVRALIGHGVGKNLHEEPDVPNYGKAGTGVRLEDGLTIAIEPMVGMGTHKVLGLDDGWTIITADRSNAAHYENTVAIVDGKPVILTEGGE